MGTVVTADDSAWVKMFMAKAYAGLGRKVEAKKLGEKAYSQIPIERDAIDGITLMDDLLNIYIRIGEYDKAIDLIDTMLSKPSPWTAKDVKNHPYGDPLHDLPRFKALMEKYDTGL